MNIELSGMITIFIDDTTVCFSARNKCNITENGDRMNAYREHRTQTHARSHVHSIFSS